MCALLLHGSVDAPPHIPAFASTHKRKGFGHIAELTTVLTQIVGGITPTLQTSSSANTIATAISPVKMANLHSNYLQQNEGPSLSSWKWEQYLRRNSESKKSPYCSSWRTCPRMTFNSLHHNNVYKTVKHYKWSCITSISNIGTTVSNSYWSKSH